MIFIVFFSSCEIQHTIREMEGWEDDRGNRRKWGEGRNGWEISDWEKFVSVMDHSINAKLVRSDVCTHVMIQQRPIDQSAQGVEMSLLSNRFPFCRVCWPWMAGWQVQDGPDLCDITLCFRVCLSLCLSLPLSPYLPYALFRPFLFSFLLSLPLLHLALFFSSSPPSPSLLHSTSFPPSLLLKGLFLISRRAIVIYLINSLFHTTPSNDTSTTPHHTPHNIFNNTTHKHTMDNFIENVSGYSMWDIRNAIDKVYVSNDSFKEHTSTCTLVVLYFLLTVVQMGWWPTSCINI